MEILIIYIILLGLAISILSAIFFPLDQIFQSMKKNYAKENLQVHHVMYHVLFKKSWYKQSLIYLCITALFALLAHYRFGFSESIYTEKILVVTGCILATYWIVYLKLYFDYSVFMEDIATRKAMFKSVKNIAITAPPISITLPSLGSPRISASEFVTEIMKNSYLRELFIDNKKDFDDIVNELFYVVKQIMALNYGRDPYEWRGIFKKAIKVIDKNSLSRLEVISDAIKSKAYVEDTSLISILKKGKLGVWAQLYLILRGHVVTPIKEYNPQYYNHTTPFWSHASYDLHSELESANAPISFWYVHW